MNLQWIPVKILSQYPGMVVYTERQAFRRSRQEDSKLKTDTELQSKTLNKKKKKY